MARILPRLLAQLQRKPLVPVDHTKFVLPRRRPTSLHRPTPPPPPSFSPAHYDRSILLHDPENNIITRSSVYARHKTLPPLPRRLGGRRTSTKDDGPRAMTREERRFWSSPYLRMIASPLRQCLVSHRFLPTDFLIRLAIHRIPPTHYPNGWKRPEPPQTFLPDGLQHTKFTARRSGKAHYVVCSRRAIALLADPAVKRRTAFGVPVHPLLADQIAHLLRLRVLQELELLADHLERPPSTHRPRAEKDNKEPQRATRLVRRLTNTEWQHIRDTETIPHPGALAVLVVPPLQKDRATGLRPEPNMLAAPPPPASDHAALTARRSASTPPCVLYPVRAATEAEWDENAGQGVVPRERVPLYHGSVMFPDRGQRAAMHASLLRLLRAEWNAGYVHERGAEKAEGNGNGNGNRNGVGKDKPSHAFLVSSNAETVLRGDTAPLAIALWRLRMFEDPGEDIASESTGGWEWTGTRKGPKV
ncbi:hypothetical protein H0H87_011551 [Tephrocybe sp. NHM501043]|nr:hypothetical protein H0H87_011551 [Tephrocybe sp. NHM501043]